MPETRSAQGALPLRSAYPARDLTHSTGRRAISPDKTTGIPGKRLWPSFLFVQCRTQSALDIFHRPYTLRSLQLVRQKNRGRRGIPPALCRLRPGAAADRSRPMVRGRLVHGHRARHLRLTAADSTRKGIEHTFRFSNPPYSGIYGKAFFCLVNPFRHDQP